MSDWNNRRFQLRTPNESHRKYKRKYLKIKNKMKFI